MKGAENCGVLLFFAKLVCIITSLKPLNTSQLKEFIPFHMCVTCFYSSQVLKIMIVKQCRGGHRAELQLQLSLGLCAGMGIMSGQASLRPGCRRRAVDSH